jgi:hypothetical protein
VFSLGLALSRQRALMRRILSEHAPDHARQQLAESVVRPRAVRLSGRGGSASAQGAAASRGRTGCRAVK